MRGSPSRPLHVGLANNPHMKTEELLRRQAAEHSIRVDHRPWLVPGHPDDVVVTLFEGIILEDGSTIPDIGVNPPN